MKRMLAAIALASIGLTPAMGNTNSTEEMIEYCRGVVVAHSDIDGTMSMDLSFGTGMCYGAFSVIQKMASRNSAVCMPKNVSLLQIVRIFEAYALQHPEYQSEHFFSIAALSLTQAFPCSNTMPTRGR